MISCRITGMIMALKQKFKKQKPESAFLIFDF
jgi:hypothetical protein